MSEPTESGNAELIARLRALRLHDTADDRETVTLPIALEAADALAAADASKLELAKHVDGCVRVAADALASVAQARRDALEDAIAACEKEQRGFLSAEYATPQPIGSISERFGCGACIAAVRSLIDKEPA